LTTKGPNLARGKDTAGSTTPWNARAAVDGITSVVKGIYLDSQCVYSRRSDNGTPAWWGVDLGSFYPLTGIKIYNLDTGGTLCCSLYYFDMSHEPFHCTLNNQFYKTNKNK